MRSPWRKRSRHPFLRTLVTDVLPAMAALALTAWFVLAHKGQLLVQVYGLITAGYLTFFPLINYLLKGAGATEFARYEWLILICFQVPLLGLMHCLLAWFPPQLAFAASSKQDVRLSPWLPWILALVLLVFLWVAIGYDLLFRRSTHQELQLMQATVPVLLLYVYRCAVETSFFVVIFLVAMLRSTPASTVNYRSYQYILATYLLIFIPFFLVNSRMQLAIMAICVACVWPGGIAWLTKRRNLFGVGVLLLILIFGHTALRELVIEGNSRIPTDHFSSIMRATGELIVARLDTIAVFYSLGEHGFNPWAFQFSGLAHVFDLYFSYFFDQAAYVEIKKSLVTSASVEIVNRLLHTQHVDFPKSMLMDMFLSFGVLGLGVVGVLLACTVAMVQRQINAMKPAYLLALYIMPMLLQFEKEFIATLFAFVKWLPIFGLVYLLRPVSQNPALPVDQSTLDVVIRGQSGLRK
jgi:hypothetical protein